MSTHGWGASRRQRGRSTTWRGTRSRPPWSRTRPAPPGDPAAYRSTISCAWAPIATADSPGSGAARPGAGSPRNVEPQAPRNRFEVVRRDHPSDQMPTGGDRVHHRPSEIRGRTRIAINDRDQLNVGGSKRHDPVRRTPRRVPSSLDRRQAALAIGRVGGRIRTGDPESGRPDSNRRTSATQTRRSTRLSYAPVGASMAAATMHGACRIVDAARAWAISLPRLRR
jgi:hypothetical protein